MIKLIESLGISASPYINAALFILVFVLMAKAADYLLNKIFRVITREARFGVDDAIIDAVHRPVFFTVLAIGFSMAISYLEMPEKFVFYTDGALYSLVAILWMLSAVKISNTIIENAVRKVSNTTGLSNDIGPLVKNITKIIIVVSVFIIILGVWRVNFTPILASAGLAGVAVALAAKDTIANFFGGISIFVDKPFKISDYIVLEGGERGEVVNIGIRSTKVKTPDDIIITVPNSTLINSKISNESAHTPYRIRIPVPAAYGSDIDFVEKVLVELVMEDDNVMKVPAPRADLTAFGEHGLNFELLCWIKNPGLRPFVIDRVNRSVYKKFGEQGIGIPFVPSDVHISQVKD